MLNDGVAQALTRLKAAKVFATPLWESPEAATTQLDSLSPLHVRKRPQQTGGKSFCFGLFQSDGLLISD